MTAESISLLPHDIHNSQSDNHAFKYSKDNNHILVTEVPDTNALCSAHIPTPQQLQGMIRVMYRAQQHRELINIVAEINADFGALLYQVGKFSGERLVNIVGAHNIWQNAKHAKETFENYDPYVKVIEGSPTRYTYGILWRNGYPVEEEP